MKKILMIVGMQRDLIDGVFGTEEAKAIIPNVVKRIKSFKGDMVFLMNYIAKDKKAVSKNGVCYCLEGTEGAETCPEIRKALEGKSYGNIAQRGFGTFGIVLEMNRRFPGENLEAEIVGVPAETGVVTNALILRSGYPEAEITVDSSCCAGLDPEDRGAALRTLSACRIKVK